MIIVVGKNKRLKVGAVPSIFTFRKPVTECVQHRRNRHDRRQQAGKVIHRQLDIGCDVEIANALVDNMSLHETVIEQNHMDEATQCLFPPRVLFSVVMFQHNERVIKYYTGFESYNHFHFFSIYLVHVYIICS
jgi:hypothetical protein